MLLLNLATQNHCSIDHLVIQQSLKGTMHQNRIVIRTNLQQILTRLERIK